MSLLEAVTQGRELRDEAQAEFLRALHRAQEGGHSLREIGRAADMSFNGVRWLLGNDKRAPKRETAA